MNDVVEILEESAVRSVRDSVCNQLQLLQ